MNEQLSLEKMLGLTYEEMVAMKKCDQLVYEKSLEAFEKKMAEHKAKHERRDKENYHNYKGCVMGRSDWKRDFQNHTKVAIKRSMYLKDMAI